MDDYLDYPGPQTEPTPRGPMLDRQTVIDTYARLLHRAPSESDINTHMRNPGGYEGFLSTVSGSPEARNYTDLTQPRSNPWDAPNSSIYAPRIVQEGGNTFLTEHGNRRQLQPNEVAPATSYRDQFWGNNPTGFQPGVGPQINSAYAPPSGPGSAGSTAATASTGRRGWNNLALDPRSGGATAGFEGFNNDRALAGGDANSIKDGFFRFAQGFAFDPRGKSKDELGAFLQSQIGAAKEFGIDILDVKGDQILVRTHENPNGEWVDVFRNAGGGADGAWQWGAQNVLGPAPTTAPTQEPRSDNPDRNVAMSSTPTYNPDGTVTLRISPDAYRKLATADPLTYASLTQRA